MSAGAASAVSLMVAKLHFVARGTTVAGNFPDAGQ
jgi:hypothetical protein